MDWPENNLCIKCNEGGNLLVCGGSGCPLVIHERCMGCPARFEGEGNFYCPYCLYKRAVSESRRAREYEQARKKDLVTFMAEGVKGGEKHSEANEGDNAKANGCNSSKVSEGNVNVTMCGDDKINDAEEGKVLEMGIKEEICNEEEIQNVGHDDASLASSGQGTSPKMHKHKGMILEEESETSSDSGGQDSLLPQWSWKRPSFQGTKAKVITYPTKNALRDFQRALDNDPETVEILRRSCFGIYLRMDLQGGLCMSALHQLLGFEITVANAKAEELWFRVGKTNIRFSKNEFALVTGLRFGDRSLSTGDAHSPHPEGIYSRLFAGRGVSIKVIDLMRRFSAGEFRRESAADNAKIYKIIFVYLFVLGLDVREKRVEDWIWALIDDDERWDIYPWGTLGYENLLHYLTKLTTTCTGKYHIYGCSTALMCWLYEAVPLLGDTCAVRLVNLEVQCPRMLRWQFLRLVKVNLSKYFKGETLCYPFLEKSPEEERLYEDWWLFVVGECENAVTRSPSKKRKRVASPKAEATISSARKELVLDHVTSPAVDPITPFSIKVDTSTSQLEAGDDFAQLETRLVTRIVQLEGVVSRLNAL